MLCSWSQGDSSNEGEGSRESQARSPKQRNIGVYIGDNGKENGNYRDYRVYIGFFFFIGVI